MDKGNFVTDGSTENLRKDVEEYTPYNRSSSTIEEDETEFKERGYDETDPYEYKYDKEDPGFVLIVNQKEFENRELYTLNTRSGTDRDEEEIVKCLGCQGYNIHQENIMRDATVKDLDDKVAKVCNSEQLKHTNCLIVFVLSHGGSDEEIEMYDGSFTINRLIQPFLSVTALQNKPKIFIIQACKVRERPALPTKQLYSDIALRKEPNVLIAYATLEGDYSYRDPTRGSVFIQQLCRNIYQHGHREDFLSILLRCNKGITKGPYIELANADEDQQLKEVDANNEEKKSYNLKQTPMFMSTLKKHFYICRDKDRRFQLNMLHDLNHIIEHKQRQIKSKCDSKIHKKNKRKDALQSPSTSSEHSM